MEIRYVPAFDREMVIGLSWRAVHLEPGVGQGKMRKELLSGVKSPKGALVRRKISMAIGLGDKKAGRAAIAGAAVLAHLCTEQEKALFGIPVEGGFWVCGIQGGVPLATTDIFIEEDEWERHRIEYEGYGFTVYEEADLLQRIHDGNGLSKKLNSAAKKAISKSKYRTVTAVDPQVVLAVTLGSIVIAGLVGSVFFWQKQLQKKTRQLQMAMSAKDLEKQQEDERRKRIENLKLLVANKIQSPGVSFVIDGWQKDLVKNLIPSKGWVFTSVTCNYQNCEAFYNREKGYLRDFAAADVASLTNINQATRKFLAPITFVPVDSDEVSVKADLAKFDTEMRREIASVFQEIANVGISAKISDVTRIADLPYSSMSFDINGASPSEINKIKTRLEMMNLKQSIQVNHFRLAYESGKPSWRIKGEFVFSN